MTVRLGEGGCISQVAELACFSLGHSPVGTGCLNEVA